MQDKKLIQALLVAVVMSSSMLVGAVAITFFTKQMDSSITVVANGYIVSLYSDVDLTNEVTEFSFSELMADRDAYSEWVDIYVKFETNPEAQVWGHISTVNMPDGLTLVGQIFRSEATPQRWDYLDIDDDTCDFGNSLVDDSYAPLLRFRVERTDSATGSFAFQTVFTIMDISTIS